MDKRVEKSYDKIQHAYSRLIMHKDYDDITVNDICIEAGIKRPTFYNHFNDKDDFLSKIYRYRLDNIVEFYSLDRLTSFRAFVLKLLKYNLTYLNNFKKDVGILNEDKHVSSMYYITFRVIDLYLQEKYDAMPESKNDGLTDDERRFLVYSYSSMFISYSILFYLSKNLTPDQMMKKVESAIPSTFKISK